MTAYPFLLPDNLSLVIKPGVKLNGDDVLSLWAFLTLSHGELNALAFSQGFKTFAYDGAEMCENVWA